jgi:MFS family permease
VGDVTETHTSGTQRRDFRLLATGQSLSWIGNGFQTVALAAAIILGGGGASDLGLVLAASILAMLACTLFGGVWADRVQPQLVMVLSDLIRCLAVAGMAVMFGVGYHSLPLLTALAAITAGAGAFFSPAMTALKPMVVTIERRQAANATLGLLQTTSSVIGPALGGVIVAAFGAPSGFAVDSASFVASMVTVALIRARVDRAPHAGMLHELREGWSEVRQRDWLLSGMLAATVYHVANGVVLVLTQVVAIRDLGGASALGVIAAAQGAGGVLGAAIAMRYRPTRLLRAGWLTLLLMPIWVLSYVWPAALTAVALGAVLGYAGLSFFSVAWDTAIQDHVPHRVIARVASWDTLTSFVGMPVGNALAGPLAHTFGINHVFIASAVVLFVSGASPLFVAGSRRLVRPTMTQSESPVTMDAALAASSAVSS